MNNTALIQCGRIRLHFTCKPCTGKDKIHLRENRAVFQKDVCTLCNLSRKLLQDPLDFLLTCKFHLPYGIVQLHGRERLYKECRPAGRLIVNHARKIIAVFLLDRNDIALIAYGDNGFLKVFLICCIVQDRREAILDTRLRRLEFACDPAQFKAGIVTEIAVFINGVLEMTLHHAENFDWFCHRLQMRGIQCEIAKEVFHIPHPAHRTHHGAQFIDLKDSTHRRFFQQCTQIIDPPEWRRLHLLNLHRLRRLMMEAHDFVIISAWYDAAAKFLAAHGGGKRSKPICDFPVFQNLK